MFYSLQKLFRSAPKAARPALRTRPNLECLEARIVAHSHGAPVLDISVKDSFNKSVVVQRLNVITTTIATKGGVNEVSVVALNINK